MKIEDATSAKNIIMEWQFVQDIMDRFQVDWYLHLIQQIFLIVIEGNLL